MSNGVVAERFSLHGTLRIAGAAQTQGTDLADYHDAASNPIIITTNNLIPGGVKTVDARIFFSADLAAAPVENLANIMGCWVIERVNGVEVARWNIYELGAMIGYLGVLTSGAHSSLVQVPTVGVGWERAYDPDVTHELALQINRTLTTVGIVSTTFVERGTRGNRIG